MSHHGLTDEQQQQSFFSVLLRAKQTDGDRNAPRESRRWSWTGMRGEEKREKQRKSVNERMERVTGEKYTGSSLILGAMLAIFHCIPT